MSISNKLFSLLGFPEPIDLERFDGNDLLPQQVLLLSTSKQPNNAILQSIESLNINVLTTDDTIADKSLKALVIDATDFITDFQEDDAIDEHQYFALYEKLHHSIKLLAKNARVVIIGNKLSATDDSIKSVQLDAFNEGLVGFTKSIAKEIGHNGSTANLIFTHRNMENLTAADQALVGPLQFLLSAKSTFVSGQVMSVNSLSCHEPKPSDKQKVAVVTGAAQGIGAAIVNKLASEGYFVVGVDIEPARENLTLTMNNVKGTAFVLDVSEDNAGNSLAEVVSEYGGIDLMVHNAGITRDKTIAKMPTHWWQQTLNINLLSVMRINQQLQARQAINANGRIVCLSSMNGIAGQRGQTNYACSKAGIIGYVTSISSSLAKQGITINAVAPGFIETQMTNDMPFFTREMGRRMNALGQGGLPIDVAETVAFLGETSSYGVSGQTIRVCGLNLIGK